MTLEERVAEILHIEDYEALEILVKLKGHGYELRRVPQEHKS